MKLHTRVCMHTWTWNCFPIAEQHCMQGKNQKRAKREADWMMCLTGTNQSIQSVISACTTSIQVLLEWRIIDSRRTVKKSISSDDGSFFGPLPSTVFVVMKAFIHFRPWQLYLSSLFLSVYPSGCIVSHHFRNGFKLLTGKIEIK